MAGLRASGWTLDELAKRYRLSRQRVHQIVDSSPHGRVPRREVSAIRRGRRAADARADFRVGEVLGFWRQGLPREEIRVRVGVTLEAIREIVAAYASDEDHEARRVSWQARMSVGKRPRYSERELIRGLQRVASRLGHAPTGPEYAELATRFGLAAAPTVYARFGSWGNALEAAGLARSSHAGGPAPRWDSAACWEALLSVADQLGDPPRYRRYLELARERDDLPSGSILTRRLGLWSQIVAVLNAQQFIPVSPAWPGDAISTLSLS